MKIITTIEEFYKYYQTIDMLETELNRHLLDLMRNSLLTTDVFIEYLEITQAEVDTCLGEALNYNGFYNEES